MKLVLIELGILMICAPCNSLLRNLPVRGFPKLEATTLYYLNPIKALTAGSLLYIFKEHYHELRIIRSKKWGWRNYNNDMGTSIPEQKVCLAASGFHAFNPSHNDSESSLLFF